MQTMGVMNNKRNSSVLKHLKDPELINNYIVNAVLDICNWMIPADTGFVLCLDENVMASLDGWFNF